jgi:hypothetical protein
MVEEMRSGRSAISVRAVGLGKVNDEGKSMAGVALASFWTPTPQLHLNPRVALCIDFGCCALLLRLLACNSDK